MIQVTIQLETLRCISQADILSILLDRPSGPELYLGGSSYSTSGLEERPSACEADRVAGNCCRRTSRQASDSIPLLRI
jgi:hypothetical protein